MISQIQAARLKNLINEVRSADEQLQRVHSGYSNKTLEEARALLKQSQTEMKSFIESITEKENKDA